MCNITNLLLVICINLAVTNAVDGYTFKLNNSSRTRRQAGNNGNGKGCANSGEFRCNSGECISEAQKCDGRADCEDGSDETSATCFGITCPRYTYQCRYGACVDGNAECDGIKHCSDGSDEDSDKCDTTQNPTQSVTKLPIPDRSPGDDACTLPNHPDFGKWSISGPNFNFSPGMRVEQGMVLQLSCQNGYKLEGDPLIFCSSGNWSAGIGKCSKTCPPKYSTIATKVICVNNGTERENCTDATDGTRVKYECAPFYENLNLQRLTWDQCRDGSWSYPHSECTPICGEKSVGAQMLIINGTTTEKGEYPWQVALYSGERKRFICGGTLISQRIILTAAECVTDVPNGEKLPKDRFTVAVGKDYSDHNDFRDDYSAQFSSLDDIFIPETYRGIAGNLRSDIAILVTTKTFTFSRRVQPVCVDWTINPSFSDTYRNKFGYVAGWGFTKETGSSARQLKEIKVPLIDHQKCLEDLPETMIPYLTTDKLCAGYLNQSTAVCKGDGGGGLFVKYNGKYYIIGIVSVTAPGNMGGCNSQQYTLYTNVTKYTDPFILEKEIQYRSFQPQQTVENIEQCILPQHPNNGRLSVLGSKLSPNPDSTVPLGTTVQVTCDEFYILQGPSTVECHDGRWDSPVGICLAPCPPLMSTRSIEVSCHGANCINNTHGTIATFKCAPFYENLDLNINPFRSCQNGEWKKLEIPRCVPVCGVKPEFSTQQKNSDYPWNAAIYKKDEEGKRRFVCAGTLINERIILTSAQCISGKDGKKLSLPLFEVAAGKSTEDYDDPQDVEAQFSDLEEIFVPDEYKGNTRKYWADIAVLITKKPFNMTQRVQLLCLDWKNTFAKEFEYPKIRGQIAAIFEYQSSRNFFEIEVPFVDDTQCYKQLSEDLEFDSSYYTFDKLCSGYINLNKTPSCNLNLGTGLISKNRHDNRYYLIGIASVFSSNLSKNCSNQKWVLFTQVSKYSSNFIFEKNKLYTPLYTQYSQTSCGVKSVQAQTLIVDGNNVTKGDYPWQVAIYNVSDTKKVLICGGSLINQRIILTAAHCMTDSQGNKRPKEMFTVAVGKYYRDFNHSDDKNAQFSALIDISVPDLYQGELQNYVGDIAILITEKSFVLSRQVMPVCVDWENKYEGQFLRPYAKGYVRIKIPYQISLQDLLFQATGWGFTKENSNPSQILKDLEVPYVERNLCKKDIPEDYEVYLTFDKICSGYLNKSKNVCRGDSGGGLVFKNGIDDRYYIAGIVSLSPQAPTGGCNSQQYALYTRVSQYVKEFIGKKAQTFWR